MRVRFKVLFGVSIRVKARTTGVVEVRIRFALAVIESVRVRARFSIQ